MKKTRFILTALLCGSVLLNTVPVTAEGGSPEDFDRWMEEQFVEAMEEDYVNMHFTVRDHQALGIEKPELKIGEVGDLESYAEEIKDIEDTLKELEQFDYEKLSDAQKADYDIYKTYLVRLKELNSFPMMDFYFLPTGGITDNLTTNFSEFKFYEKTDFEDYLTVLSTVDEYVDEALELTRTQAKNGYFMTDSALDKTEEAIDRFVEKTDNNELIVIFEKNVDAFEGLSAEEKETYKKKNRDIILNSYKKKKKKAKTELEKENTDALKAGLPNLAKHIENVTKVFGLPAVVAINRFPSDTDAEIEVVREACEEHGVTVSLSEVWEKGGEGALDLASKVLDLTEQKSHFKYVYDTELPVRDKIKKIVNKVYGGKFVQYSVEADRQIARIEELGLNHLPICMAKTQYSLTDDPKVLGRPEDFKVHVKSVSLSAGAGFIVVLTGDIMTMPGLPKVPSAEKIDIDSKGRISGLF